MKIHVLKLKLRKLHKYLGFTFSFFKLLWAASNTFFSEKFIGEILVDKNTLSLIFFIALPTAGSVP